MKKKLAGSGSPIDMKLPKLSSGDFQVYRIWKFGIPLNIWVFQSGKLPFCSKWSVLFLIMPFTCTISCCSSLSPWMAGKQKRIVTNKMTPTEIRWGSSDFRLNFFIFSALIPETNVMLKPSISVFLWNVDKHFHGIYDIVLYCVIHPFPIWETAVFT